MDQTMNENAAPTIIEKQEDRSRIRHIVFVHFTRLAWLLLTVVAILLLTFLVRNLTSSAGFVVEQQINIISVIVGLVLVAIVYTIGVIRMLRKIREWEQQGKTTLATGGLLGLGITPILMALPIVLMFLIH
jgi:hypothetical protein